MFRLKEKTIHLLPFLRACRRKNSTSFTVSVWVHIPGEQRCELSLGYAVDKDEWDETAKRPILTGNRPDLKKLDSVITVTMTKLQQTYDYLTTVQEKVTPRQVISCFRGEDVKKKPVDHGILSIFNSETDRFKKMQSMAEGTLKRRESMRRGFQDFIKKTYGKDDYPVEKVDVDFIRKYETYLLADRGQAQNTLVRNIKFLKTIVYFSIANGYITRNPFYGIKYHSEPVDHPFLTVNELQSILSKEISIDRLRYVRDVFCFCCLTGLAYVDVSGLLREDIIEYLGEHWIHKKRQKSSQIYDVPLCDVAYAIVKKYMENPIPMPNEHKLFPVTSNQKMNAYLKELADICGISKNLTTHCARRTFATLSQAFGSKLQNIAKMMGHSSIAMTQKYARILDSSILEDSSKMNGHFTYAE